MNARRFVRVASVALIVALAGCSGVERNAPVVPIAGTSARAAAQVTIYSNLASGKHRYRCCIAWTIGGPRSKIGQQWLAASFTPASDGTATIVRLGLTWSLGANASLTVALAQDSHGHPGNAIASGAVPAKLPAFNHCCALQNVSFAKPGSLKKGVRYWLVVRTNAATRGTVDNWQNNIVGAGGVISTQNGKGWGNAQLGKGLPAFAVFGR